MIDLVTIINKIKEIENIKDDKEVAEKLGITAQNLYQMRKRNKIPYFEIIKYCNDKKISTDLFFLNKMIDNDKKNDMMNKLENTIKKLNEKESAYFYFMIETKLAEKEL